MSATGDGEDLTLGVARSIRLGASSTSWYGARTSLVVGATGRGVELLTELFPGDEEDVDDSFLASAFAKREETLAGHQAIQREELLPEPIMAPRHTPTPEPVAEPRLNANETTTARSSDVGKRTVVDSVGVYSRPSKGSKGTSQPGASAAPRPPTTMMPWTPCLSDSQTPALGGAQLTQQTKTDTRSTSTSSSTDAAQPVSRHCLLRPRTVRGQSRPNMPSLPVGAPRTVLVSWLLLDGGAALAVRWSGTSAFAR